MAPFHPLRDHARDLGPRAGAAFAVFVTIAVILLAGGNEGQLASADVADVQAGAASATPAAQPAPTEPAPPPPEPTIPEQPVAAEAPAVEAPAAPEPQPAAPEPQPAAPEPQPAAEAGIPDKPPAADREAGAVVASRGGGDDDDDDDEDSESPGGGIPDDEDDSESNGGGDDDDGDDDGDHAKSKGGGGDDDDDDGDDGDDDSGWSGGGGDDDDDDEDEDDDSSSGGGGDDDDGSSDDDDDSEAPPPSGGDKGSEPGDDDDSGDDDEPAPSGRGQVVLPPGEEPGETESPGGDSGGPGTPTEESPQSGEQRGIGTLRERGPRAGEPGTTTQREVRLTTPGGASSTGGTPADPTVGEAIADEAAETGLGETGAGGAAGAGAGGAGAGDGAGAGAGDGDGEPGAGGAGGEDGGQGSGAEGEEDINLALRMVKGLPGVVEEVPEALKAALAALAALSVLLGTGYLFSALRARRLARQRRELLQEVGLLQSALLPPVPEKIGALLTTVAYRPADGPGAGGDFYDVLPLAGGRVGFILGDVSGHGRGALARTAFMRYTLRAYLEAGLEPRVALQVAGRVIDENLGGDFATVLLAVHDPETGSLTYATAGHPAPIVVGPQPHEPVTAGSSPPIGVGVRTGLRQTTVPLVPGSVAALFTDGLMEARTDDGILGRERLAELLDEIGEDATASRLIDRVAAEANLLSDDMAAVVVTPTAGVTAGLFRTEQLELSARELDGPIARRFLEATGLPQDEVEEAERDARLLAERFGGVVLHVVFGNRLRVEVLPRNVESIEAASRRVSAGSSL